MGKIPLKDCAIPPEMKRNGLREGRMPVASVSSSISSL
jgi:hypothetical protein